MAERIEIPPMPGGPVEKQLQEIWSYLNRLAKTMNRNLDQIGNSALTDNEQVLINELSGMTGAGVNSGYTETETLKSLIIKTAQYVKTEMERYRTAIYGTDAEGSGENWDRKQGVSVVVTPDGIRQTYSYADLLKLLKQHDVQARNYIRTGFLRTENGASVYGVAIGKDVVTFGPDGTETYHDSSRVAEFTDEHVYLLVPMKTDAGLTADSTGVILKNSMIRGNHYALSGSPLLGREDIVVSSEEPEAAEGRIWVKPQDTVIAQYTKRVPAAQSFGSGALSFTLAGTAVTGQEGDVVYTLELPVYCKSTSGGALNVTAAISDGTNTVTFTAEAIAQASSDTDGYHSKQLLKLSVTDEEWLATGTGITLTVTPASNSAAHGVDAGEIILRACALGSVEAGWDNCEIKVYQG